MQKKNWKKLVGIASAAMLAATQTIPAVAVSAAEDTTDYVYCYAALTWAEYWQNEGVYLDDAADGDLGASSTEKDTHGEYDLGAYDAVTRATSNHGLHRGSYQCTVKVYDTEGNAYCSLPRKTQKTDTQNEKTLLNTTFKSVFYYL